MAAKKLKASEKSALLTKLTTALKKKFGSKAPKADRSVLESYMYAACVEDTTDEAAEVAFAKLLDSFHDLNEIRVSTVAEIERPLDTLPQPEFRAMRIREALQHVFEKHFAFDLDSLKKKNLDGATSDLDAVTEVTPFIKLYTLQNGLGAHVVPVDGNQLVLLKWLGIVPGDMKEEAAGDDIKSAVRKSDGQLFAYLLRQCASEPVVIEELSLALDDDDDEIDVAERLSILQDLLSGKRKPTKKKVAKKSTSKPAAKSKAAKKSTTTKTATKTKTAKKATKTPKKKTAAPAKKTKTPAKKKSTSKKATKKKSTKKK